jgi:hypothetical protein
MRLSRKAASLLAAGLMAAGVTAAAAPANASGSYFEILTLPQGDNGPVFCVEGGGTQGSAVTQQPCDTGTLTTAQAWLPVNQGGDVYKFVNAASGLCLDARGGAADGTPAELWSCSANISNTRWEWPPSADSSSPQFVPGFGLIGSRVSGSTGFCLEVPLGQGLPGLQLQLFGCSHTSDEIMLITQPAS